MAVTADRIMPGASVAEAIAHLDADPARKLTARTRSRTGCRGSPTPRSPRWPARTSTSPRRSARSSAASRPTQHGGIYYTGPSEDLVTRPGRMWWSVPKGVTEFGTWRELSTVYHEGVPGHHLQIAQTAYRRDLLNRWRRLASWVSGHGEGWALYAERLMADLGFLDDPADYLGMLDAQSLRAARVVLDIGVHCGLPAPAEVGGGEWTYDKAWEFLGAHANMSDGVRRFELDRYLGWPGQAPSYKVGERLWLQLRDDVRAPQGAAFDLAAFHRRALDLGSVGLDVLRAAVLGDDLVVLIHPWDAGTSEQEWVDFVRAQGFGHLVAAGRDRDVPVVVPTQFALAVDAAQVVLHLARPNPIWTALDENPDGRAEHCRRLGLRPGRVEGDRRRGPALGRAHDVLRGGAAHRGRRGVDDPGAKAEILRVQLGVTEPGRAPPTRPSTGGCSTGIRGLRLPCARSGRSSSTAATSTTRIAPPSPSGSPSGTARATRRRWHTCAAAPRVSDASFASSALDERLVLALGFAAPASGSRTRPAGRSAG